MYSANVFAAVNLQCSIRTFRIPPEVSLPIPIHAKIESANVQFKICTSSVGRASANASAPRPLFNEMQSSPDAISQPSIRTRLHESMSIPSPFPPVLRIVRFLITMSLQYVGWIDHIR